MYNWQLKKKIGTVLSVWYACEPNEYSVVLTTATSLCAECDFKLP